MRSSRSRGSVLFLVPLVLPLAMFGCSGEKATDSGTPDGEADADADADADSDTDADADADADTANDRYAFSSAFQEGSSVSYSGQVFRQVLIDDMATHLGGMTDRINGGFYPEPGELTEELDFYLSFDSSTSGAVDLLISSALPLEQQVYDDISSDKDLVGKLAGNDPVGQHRDWAAGMDGWGAPGSTSPEALVRAWMGQIDDQGQLWISGDYPQGPDGAPVPAVYVTPEGLDLQQLLEKFLRGAVGFSQGADDYLDDDEAGKGLLADHSQPAEGKPYTELEHQWDEGFGYFGASRSFGDRPVDEIAEVADHDIDANGTIDLLRERDFGHSRNAGKRDAGAVSPTSLAEQAFDGFLAGRTLLSETAGTDLSTDQLATLQEHRDQALGAWEAAIAASVVHYINDTLQDMGTFDSDAYDFGDHAKHWSELKGFALSLQFNRRSPLSADDFRALHVLVGDRPVLPTATPEEQADYRAALLEARTLVGERYGFDAGNLGDEDGNNGW